MKIYACLCGEWCCLNDDPDCVMGIHMQTPSIWYEEGAKIADSESNNEVSPAKDSYYNMDYIHIHYHGKDYRINPILIQNVFSYLR